jgi:hypothetical protein
MSFELIAAEEAHYPKALTLHRTEVDFASVTNRKAALHRTEVDFAGVTNRKATDRTAIDRNADGGKEKGAELGGVQLARPTAHPHTAPRLILRV